MPQYKNSAVAPANDGGRERFFVDQSGRADDQARIAQRRNASVGNPVGPAERDEIDLASRGDDRRQIAQATQTA
jgi:hypothetical protein